MSGVSISYADFARQCFGNFFTRGKWANEVLPFEEIEASIRCVLGEPVFEPQVKQPLPCMMPKSVTVAFLHEFASEKWERNDGGVVWGRWAIHDNTPEGRGVFVLSVHVDPEHAPILYLRNEQQARRVIRLLQDLETVSTLTPKPKLWQALALVEKIREVLLS